MARKRKSDPDVIEILFELTGWFWQVAAVITTCLLVLSYMAFQWAVYQEAVLVASKFLGPVLGSYGFAYYLLPLIPFVLACVLGVKTYESYCREHI